MNHKRASAFPRRQASPHGSPRAFRLDEETLLALEGIAKWFDEQHLCYSDTVIVRASIRDYLQRILASTPEDFEDIARAAEAASGISGRRVK